MNRQFLPFTDMFTADLSTWDKEIFDSLCQEERRQQDGIELIASENFVSKPVLQALGSIMTNKYAEGYPKKRYYGGCEYVDRAEEIALDRVKKLFGTQFANVQPHSGSQANQAVFMSLLKPGDSILGLSLECGGHLTHGSPVNQSGKWFHALHYTVDRSTHLIDMGEVEHLAKKHRPNLIIAGGSAYSREWDFKSFREIADSIGAYFLVDMAHIAGLVATGLHTNPFPHAHIATSTTHKTLRGPRGGIILTNDASIAKKINMSIFPGLQGGPLMHCIAAKAVAFAEALRPEFKQYIQAVKDNAKTLAQALQESGFSLVSNGTDNHLLLVDLRSKGVTGIAVEKSLERAGITCNKNTVPFDSEKPTITSGIRLGTPATTSRGFGQVEFKEIGTYIAEITDSLAKNIDDNSTVEYHVYKKVQDMCKRFPLYKQL